MDTKARCGDRNANLSTRDSTEYESDELFSDDEQKKEIQYQSEASQDVASLSPSTALSSSCAVLCNATVPSTPLSLLPFLNKVNEQWTSDLETPQAQSHATSSTSATETTEETPKLEQSMPEASSTEIDINEGASASPVIVSKTVRRRPKRRIFRLLSSPSVETPQAVINTEDPTVDANAEMSLASENPDSVIPGGDVSKDCESDILKTQDNCNKESENPANTSCSSTQEFFKNASFSKIDELCFDNLDEQPAIEPTVRYNNQKDAGRKSGAEENVNIDFTSARGASCKVSRQAAFKVKRLFADVFDADEMREYEVFAEESFVEQTNRDLPSRSLAKRSLVNVAKDEEVLAKPEPQSTEQVDQPEIGHNTKLSSIQCCFRTRRSTAKISDSLIPKRKALFAEQLNDQETTTTLEQEVSEGKTLFAENLNIESKLIEEIELPGVQCGFQTARGASIKISQSSLSKAKALLAEQLDDISNKENLEQELSEEIASFVEELDGESKTKQEIKHPSVQCSFQTARGASIKISQSSLSKAKALLAEQLHDISNKENLEQERFEEKIKFTEELNNESETRQEMKLLSVQCGFQTARGASINISQSSLSRAKTLFAEQLDDISNKENLEREPFEEKMKFTEELNNESETRQEMKLPSVECGFQTARGASIKISQSSLSRAKTLFAEQLDDISNKENLERELFEEKMKFTEELNNESETRQEMKLPNVQCGFQTARGASIKISQSSLSEAQALFAEQELLEEQMSFAEELNRECKTRQDVSEGKTPFAENLNNESKTGEELKLPSVQCGFQTARGASINISQSSLSRAKALFAEQLHDISNKENLEQEQLEEIAPVAQELNNDSKPRQEMKHPSVQCGFQTARGASIKISQSSLSRAKALFAEQLHNISDKENLEQEISEEIASFTENSNNESKISREMKHPSVRCGFQTARGASITISQSSLSEAQALFAEQELLEEQMSFAEELNRECKTRQDVSEGKTPFAENLNNESKTGEELKLPSVQCGFQTARGASIKISRSSLSRAKTLLAEQLHDISDKENLELELSEGIASFAEELNDESKTGRGMKHPSVQCDFQTARGASMKISQSSLSRAEALLGDDLNDISEPIGAEKTNSLEKVKREEGDSGFLSAVSNCSVQTLPRARISFTKRLTSPLESMIAKRNNVFGKVGNRQNTKLANVGREVQTARDTPVRKQVLYRPKALSSFPLDRLDLTPEVSVQESAGRDEDAARSDLAGGIQRTEAATDSSLKERSDESGCSDLVHASWLQKRKSSDTSSDEYTPLGRNHEGHGSKKKARLSSELQARKLFPDDADDTENRDPDGNARTGCLARSATESPERDAADASESGAAGSPIIGTVCRKRRSLGHRKETKSRSQECTSEAPPESASENEAGAPVRGARSGNTESAEEYGGTQLMMSFVDQSVRILRDRLAATLEQENAITAKRRHGCERSVGRLYRYRRANANARLPLREIGDGAPPVPLTRRELIERRVQPNVMAVTAATAASYKFQCSDFYGCDVARGNVRGIEMEDGARLIMDENGYVGVWEFQRALLASTGVDPNLVPARWVENHYRWIVWKLASMDRMRFGSVVLPRSLIPSRVMAQLRYRYDREIDRSERPALRRILEKDDVASKRMILCVSSIVENNNASPEASPHKAAQRWRIELTDGWYSVPACVDIGMLRNLLNGKVKEGTKLVMSGAELANCDQGCYPLEVTDDVCLKLHTNSTRRARWHAKLGYAPRSGPIPVELRNVCPNGGLIGRMTVVVARVYPMLYHERTASGDSVVRNAKCEEKAQSVYEQRCWSDIEAFYARAEDFPGEALSDGTDGMTIQLNEDYENLSPEELRQKEERFKQQLQSKLRQSLPGPRQVSPLLKVRVCDGNANAVLAIWLPGEEIVNTLKEGACVSVHNITASGKRGSELQLTAGRCAIFRPAKRRDTSHPARAYTPLREITSSEFAPPYGEFDTVGFVCSVGPAPYGMKDFEVAHLAYPRDTRPASHDTSYLSILFWQGIASYGYTDVLAVGSVVACANLEWRRASSWNIPAAYCTERTTFTRNPRRNHLYEPFEGLRGLITDPIEYARECVSELDVELQKKPTPTRYASNKNTPVKMCNSGPSVDKKPADFATPKLGLGVTTNYVPSTSSIQKRLERLQCYGDAPKLSPLVIRNSKRTSLQFRSPVCASGEQHSTEDTSRANQPGNSNVSR